MAIIAEYEFEYNPMLEDPASIYPKLRGTGFSMSLQTKDDFYFAQVGYNKVFKNLWIEIYNAVGELVQNRIGAVSDQNLFYFTGYYLYWKPAENKFEFGSVE